MKAHRRRPSPAPVPPISRGLQMLAWGSLGLAVVVLFGVWPPVGGDLLMHLTVGRTIWQHGDVPRTDLFSYVTAGQPFIAHSWGAGVLWYGLDASVGVPGFQVVRLALIGLALYFAYRTAQALSASIVSVIVIAPLMLGLVGSRVEFRPALFTSAILSATLWLMISVHTGRRSSRWLWALPPLCMAAINLHGGWPQLILMG